MMDGGRSVAFLTSSPCVPEADRPMLNPANGFVDRLCAALPSQLHVLYVCSSPDGAEKTDRYAAEMSQAFAEAGMPFASLTVLDRRSDSRAAQLIAQSNFVILSGGHVPTQNRYFQQINLRGLLRGYQGVLMGVSAGSMNAARVVYAQPEEEGESAGPAYRRWLDGLGLTDTMILPHYQMVKDQLLDGQRLFEDITYADSFRHAFLALVDGSYLLLEHGTERLFGEAYRIENGSLTQVGWECGGA